VLRSKNDENGILYAFDAADSPHLLYDSEQNPSRDRAGVTLHFNIPTIMNGHVYVGAKHEVDVYGLLNRKTAIKVNRRWRLRLLFPVLRMLRSLGKEWCGGISQ
jgi:hypothetical protein